MFGVISIEKRLSKIYPNMNIVRVSSYFRFALLVNATSDGDVYIIVRMVAPSKPSLNIDGVSLTEKQWKHFVPIAIKASGDFTFISALFSSLCSNDGESLPLF